MIETNFLRCQTTPIFAGLGDTYLCREMLQIHQGWKSGLRSMAPLLSLQDWDSLASVWKRSRECGENAKETFPKSVEEPSSAIPSPMRCRHLPSCLPASATAQEHAGHRGLIRDPDIGRNMVDRAASRFRWAVMPIGFHLAGYARENLDESGFPVRGKIMRTRALRDALQTVFSTRREALGNVRGTD